MGRGCRGWSVREFFTKFRLKLASVILPETKSVKAGSPGAVPMALADGTTNLSPDQKVWSL